MVKARSGKPGKMLSKHPTQLTTLLATAEPLCSCTRKHLAVKEPVQLNRMNILSHTLAAQAKGLKAAWQSKAPHGSILEHVSAKCGLGYGFKIHPPWRRGKMISEHKFTVTIPASGRTPTYPSVRSLDLKAGTKGHSFVTKARAYQPPPVRAYRGREVTTRLKRSEGRRLHSSGIEDRGGG